MEDTVKIQNLAELKNQIIEKETLRERLEVLESYIKKQEKYSISYRLFSALEDREKYIRYSLMAINQEKLLMNGVEVDRLLPVEEFYWEIGGIIGYHTACIELIAQKETRERKGNYYPPEPIDIAEDTPFVRKAVLEGVEHLGELAEIYPIGGAADRLSLKDEKTGEHQSAAPLHFCGKSLVQRLIDDLQAREYLHYKLFGKQVRIPVVMMTSNEKHNDADVKQLFHDKKWFGRREEDFFLFSQPSVPTMNEGGQWCFTDQKTLFMKPGGHGVIWKLARDKGALEWLETRGAKKAFVRQINNLIAGVDHGLLAFMGIGFSQDKQFGFAGCPRAKGVSEGVNVVIENQQGCCLTNIEYCDVEHFEVDEGEPLLANTNLLFVDIPSLGGWVEQNPIPGMLVNGKKMIIPDQFGGEREEEILRLESTMQNLADILYEEGRDLQKSFITSNLRSKTISTIKKEFAFGSSILQTPEQALLDTLANGADLLTNYCQMEIPELREASSFFQNGPSFIFTYHPALGPLYSVIGQKICGGRLAMGAELRLEIAELYLEDLDVDGSLTVLTDSIMGHLDEGVVYSNQSGKCILKNVQIRNSGLNRDATRSYWKDEIIHKEECEIFIEEGGEFYAENLTLRGDIRIRVPSGVKVEARMVDGELILTEEVLRTPSWFWEYTVNKNYAIELTQKNSG